MYRLFCAVSQKLSFRFSLLFGLPTLQSGKRNLLFILLMAITNDNFCLTVMEELAAVSGTNGDPLKNRLKTGLLDALTSSQNVDGTEVDQLYDTGTGKDNKVILKYFKPDSVSEVTETITNICTDTGAASAYVYDEVNLTLQVQSPVKLLTHAQMRGLCEDGATFERMKLIGSMFSAIEKNMNRQLISAFASGAGGLYNGGGVTGTGYTFLHQGSGELLQVDPEGYIDMMRNLMDTGMVGNPLVVAGGIFAKFADYEKIGCCNNYGVDNSQLGDFGYYYDNDLQTVLSSPSNGNEFLAFAPGAAQLVTKPMNQGQFRIVQDRDLWDTITNPASGITYDFYKVFDPCAEGGPAYTMKLALNFDLWQLPLDLFKVGDPRYAINFNWLFNALKSS